METANNQKTDLNRKPELVPKKKPTETCYADYICEFRAPTKIDFTAIMTSIQTKKTT